jgi:hypothetical protein
MTADVLQVRPVSRRLWPQRLRLVGVAPPRRWNGRLVLRCAVAGIPVGALTGILVGLVVLRQSTTDALWSYGYGAAAGLLVGLVLGAVLAALGALLSGMRSSRPVSRPRRLWVRHLADGPVTRLR